MRSVRLDTSEEGWGVGLGGTMAWWLRQLLRILHISTYVPGTSEACFKTGEQVHCSWWSGI